MCVMDLLGPINSLNNSKITPSYVCLMIDPVSRCVVTYVTRSTADSDVYRAIEHLRESLAGLPRRMQVDNALLTKNPKTRKFLESNGVRIHHGHPYVSRKGNRDIIEISAETSYGITAYDISEFSEGGNNDNEQQPS